MSKFYSASIEEARKQREAYVASLTEKERTDYLLSLLSETNGPREPPESMGVWSPTDSQGSVALLAPSETGGVEGVGINMAGAQAQEKMKRSRCGCDQTSPCPTTLHGTSYIAVDYNHGVGRGRYDIVVYVRHYGSDYYGSDWNRFVGAPAAYQLWQSARLIGPGSPGREGYFSSGNNDTPGPHQGGFGVGAYEPGTDTLAWWGIWYFDGGWDDWGNEWLRCGQDYGIWLADA